MGTQYQVWNKTKKEFIDARSLGWDSKKTINTTGYFANFLYYMVDNSWNDCTIEIIATEHREFEDANLFYNSNTDVTKKYYTLFEQEFGDRLE